jgi:hypothetical protein
MLADSLTGVFGVDRAELVTRATSNDRNAAPHRLAPGENRAEAGRVVGLR